MSKFIINGGKTLNGHLSIPCSKNAYLPILAGCILCKGEIVLHNCPNYSDIEAMCNVLKKLGAKVEKKNNSLYINANKIRCKTIPKAMTGSIRSSIFCLGSIVGRCKKAILAYPGGCAIGKRPIDIHIDGLRQLGVKIVENEELIVCEAKQLHGANINLRFPSVGATENLILASVLIKGTTILNNCAREPEIIDLCNFLNKMGANIVGAGEDRIIINGVKSLNGTEYTPMPDRIYAGTMLIACATCGGNITLNNFRLNDNEILIEKLVKTGCKVSVKGDIIKLERNGALCSNDEINTSPFPGFPTDLQQVYSVLQTVCKGTCLITENLFESRFNHVPYLQKLGAKICVIGKKMIVYGDNKLKGTNVIAEDLRGGAALVIAGLVANGETIVDNVGYIDRGYQNIEKDFISLGADIVRVDNV